MSRLPFLVRTECNVVPFERIHSDVWRLYPIKPLVGFKYYSFHRWVYKVLLISNYSMNQMCFKLLLGSTTMLLSNLVSLSVWWWWWTYESEIFWFLWLPKEWFIRFHVPIHTSKLVLLMGNIDILLTQLLLYWLQQVYQWKDCYHSTFFFHVF